MKSDMDMKKIGVLAAILVMAVSLSGCMKMYDAMGDFLPPFSMPGTGVCPQGESGGDRFDNIVENQFIKVADAPESVFSVDADGASYAVMRKVVSSAAKVGPSLRFPKASVRIEEYLNYFTFDYPEPAEGHTLALNAEAGPCPWAQGHLLLRLGLKGKSVPPAELPQSNYVFLVDVSGSMASADKLDLLKSGLKLMVTEMRPDDRVSIITYSGEVSKLLESTPASEAQTIIKAVNSLSASGMTSGGEAMKMAYEEALRNFIEGGNNRVIMGTDGDFNVGISDTETLVDMVKEYAADGIYLTVCGFGMGNLNDSMMESISNRGNGTYEYIDSEREMVRVFVDQISKFHTVADDCKVKVTFNPETVSEYRLIGYENRMMSAEDFEDDRKDAGEIGAGQTITAVYELVPAIAVTGNALGGEQNLSGYGRFDVRYRQTHGAVSDEISLDLAEGSMDVVRNGNFSANYSFAAGVAAFGMLMKDSEYKGTADFKMASELVKGGLSFDPDGYRAELLELLDTASSIERY